MESIHHLLAFTSFILAIARLALLYPLLIQTILSSAFIPKRGPEVISKEGEKSLDRSIR